jgi:hypothetical protein
MAVELRYVRVRASPRRAAFLLLLLLLILFALCDVALQPAAARASSASRSGARISDAYAPPVPTAASIPVITGTPAIGDPLSASPGSWNYDPTSFQYQWLACGSSYYCSAISDATQSTFDVTSAQAGDTLEVEVIASNSSGASTPVSSAPTASVAGPATLPALTLASSANPAVPGSALVLTATLSSPVDSGVVSFFTNGNPLPGCTALALNASGTSASCTVPDLEAGIWVFSAKYADSLYTGLLVSLTERVTATTGTISHSAQGPPFVEVGKAQSRSTPNFNLMLTAVRSPKVPYRYWFALRGVKCSSRASAVLVTIGEHQVDDRCGARIELASAALAVHHNYKLTLQAVRYRGKHAALGHAYVVRLYMPGSEVQWTPVTGVTLPRAARSIRLARTVGSI